MVEPCPASCSLGVCLAAGAGLDVCSSNPPEVILSIAGVIGVRLARLHKNCPRACCTLPSGHCATMLRSTSNAALVADRLFEPLAAEWRCLCFPDGGGTYSCEGSDNSRAFLACNDQPVYGWQQMGDCRHAISRMPKWKAIASRTQCPAPLPNGSAAIFSMLVLMGLPTSALIPHVTPPVGKVVGVEQLRGGDANSIGGDVGNTDGGNGGGHGGGDSGGGLITPNGGMACAPLVGAFTLADRRVYPAITLRWRDVASDGRWLRPSSENDCARGFVCAWRGVGGQCVPCRVGQYCSPGTANPLDLSEINRCPKGHVCSTPAWARPCSVGSACVHLTGGETLEVDCASIRTLLTSTEDSVTADSADAESVAESTTPLVPSMNQLIATAGSQLGTISKFYQSGHIKGHPLPALLCSGNSSAPSICPGGAVCADPSEALPCPPAYFCEAGSSVAARCTSFAILGLSALTLCPGGTAAPPPLPRLTLSLLLAFVLVTFVTATILSTWCRPHHIFSMQSAWRRGGGVRLHDETHGSAYVAPCKAGEARGVVQERTVASDTNIELATSSTSGTVGSDHNSNTCGDGYGGAICSVLDGRQQSDEVQSTCPGPSPCPSCSMHFKRLGPFAFHEAAARPSTWPLTIGMPSDGGGGGDGGGDGGGAGDSSTDRGSRTAAHTMYSLLNVTLEYPQLPRPVLQDVNVCVGQGSLTAILGESGSGKTSLLDVLGGQLCGQRGLRLRGEVIRAGRRDLLPAGEVGRLAQDDALLPSLTVREQLEFAARLRLPAYTTATTRSTLVDATLSVLRLGGVSGQRIGSVANRGVSGGERRRVALGVELVAGPMVLLLDESTSGIDAATALIIVRALCRYCRWGGTVVLSLHQPRTAIYSLVDDLILLSRGRVAYAGAAATAAAALASYLDGPQPPPSVLATAADFVLDVVAGVYSAEDAHDALLERLCGAHTAAHTMEGLSPSAASCTSASLAGEKERSPRKVTSTAVSASPALAPRMLPGRLMQLRVQLHRYALQRYRSRTVFAQGCVATLVGSAILSGACVANALLMRRRDCAGTPTQVAALLIIGSFSAVAFGVPAAASLSSDLLPMRREALAGVSVAPWLLARMLLDVPWLLPYVAIFTATFSDALALRTPPPLVAIAFGAHGFACAGLGLCCATLLTSHVELAASLCGLLLGGLLDGVALLPLGRLRQLGLQWLLWCSPARWTSELFLALELAHAPPDSACTWGLASYLRRHAVAPTLLEGRHSAARTLFWTNVMALCLLGLMLRIAALFFYSAKHRPVAFQPNRMGQSRGRRSADLAAEGEATLTIDLVCADRQLHTAAGSGS